jgi:hypothetical protein
MEMTTKKPTLPRPPKNLDDDWAVERYLQRLEDYEDELVNAKAKSRLADATDAAVKEGFVQELHKVDCNCFLFPRRGSSCPCTPIPDRETGRNIV